MRDGQGLWEEGRRNGRGAGQVGGEIEGREGGQTDGRRGGYKEKTQGGKMRRERGRTFARREPAPPDSKELYFLFSFIFLRQNFSM